jgi:hypothetical protein
VACGEDEVCFGGACGLKCSGGTTKCGAKCVDTQTDPQNCGACGTTCPAGEVCSVGACALQCSGGTTKCGATCVDTLTDPLNCGGCGTACPTGEVCSAGACGLKCSGGSTECGGKCVDTLYDPAHCGVCGNACSQGEVCAAGQCASQCGSGTIQCGQKCVDTQHDPQNCGGCGNACPPTQVCSAGQCSFQCTGGTIQCGSKCVDKLTDPHNCGGCGNVCPTGEVCTLGQCTLICGGGTTKCGTKCVDTQADPANCGGCGNVCAVGQVCSKGSCGGQCGGGLVMCGNQCVDIQTDPDNCGGCGNICAAGEDCVGGQCGQCDSTTTDCDKDGWLVKDGDCCDKPGFCGADPSKVNPGAIEVVGNAIDDNCNGKADLLDTADAMPCDGGLASDSIDAVDYAKAIGICRTATENPPLLKDKTWGLISAQLLRADGTALGNEHRGHSLRDKLGGAITTLEGQRMVVLSSGMAADATQTDPGPNGGAPGGGNVSTSQGSEVDIKSCTQPYCVEDWFSTANPPLKAANALPVAPSCGSGTAGEPEKARDSVMLVLRLRAPTNAEAFSFNSYFLSAEYPEYVCSTFNDQIIALVDTPAGTPSIPNPKDKNLMTYNDGSQRWPIGINIAKGTALFKVCESQSTNPGCWDSDVSPASCALGAAQLAGTGFEKASSSPGGCLIGGGTYWLTTAGNVLPGQIVEIRIAIWDVGDTAYDSLVVIDGFKWMPGATLPGTG